MNWNDLEALARELKSLIAWGVRSDRVLKKQALCRIVTERHPGLTGDALALAVITELQAAVARLASPYDECARELLMLSQYRWSRLRADTRRFNVQLRLAGLDRHKDDLSVLEDLQTFRKRTEIELMRMLADELIKAAVVAA